MLVGQQAAASTTTANINIAKERNPTRKFFLITFCSLQLISAYCLMHEMLVVVAAARCCCCCLKEEASIGKVQFRSSKVSNYGLLTSNYNELLS